MYRVVCTWFQDTSGPNYLEYVKNVPNKADNYNIIISKTELNKFFMAYLEMKPLQLFTDICIFSLVLHPDCDFLRFTVALKPLHFKLIAICRQSQWPNRPSVWCLISFHKYHFKDVRKILGPLHRSLLDIVSV